MKKCVQLIIFILIMALPLQALTAELPVAGEYLIEVTLSGGSGRAQIELPARLTVADGRATAVVRWSSPYYEYMLIDGAYYYPVNSEGNATFAIPVLLDQDMAISAQTMAMSQPHEIDYTLRFDSASLKPLAAGQGVPLRLPIAAVALIFSVLACSIFFIIKGRKKT